MIKRTLYFGNPAYLSLTNSQLVIKLANAPKEISSSAQTTIPIEDIGVVVLDNQQITITQALLEALLNNKVATITCANNHLPHGMMLPLAGNTLQKERFEAQIQASETLKNNLWQQITKAKINNQAEVLKTIYGNIPYKRMKEYSDNVLSGDSTNMEAQAASFYWKRIFPNIDDFSRNREGIPPNNILNYGYAILRAVIARSLVVSGLHPTFGIHHHNRYNAYCLADDVMEPYRPFVDKIVIDIIENNSDISILTKEIKTQILSIPTLDVVIDKKRNPLMIAAAQTTASVRQCFEASIRKVKLPSF